VAEHKSPDTKVQDVMSHEVLYCFEDQDIEEVARNMADVKVRRLPVMNRSKRLVGILSLGDLAREGDPEAVELAISHISTPGGQHSQSAQRH